MENIIMIKTCKNSGLANGLCVWATGLVASIVLATNSQAFFGNDSQAVSEAVPAVHYNFSNNASGKFKMSVEAEGEALTLGVGDGRSELSNNVETNTQTYPENYWY